MTRVLLFATHPASSNGYSKVAFEISKQLAKRPDIELTYYGFQNSNRNKAHDSERKLPPNVHLYDAFANEKTKQHGFGFDEVTEFVTLNKPDVCIVYNDMVVVSRIIDGLKSVENRKFKIIVYMDQVYQSQRKDFISRLNTDADFVMCFSKYWEKCVKDQGMTKPTGVVEHGFNPRMNYPVPKHLARTYFNLSQDDFIIVNANRNQPRKRLDLLMMAFAQVVSRHLTDPIKLVIATDPNGAWNLVEIFERELKIRGVSLEDGMKHVLFMDNPQNLTDTDINILFNASDVGINTAMGEGWGLCNFESGGIGVPQIVPAVGGFLDFFDSDCAMMIEPKVKLYTDMTVDGCPGCAEICDAGDFADAIETYYADAELRKKHGENSKKRIPENYRWVDIGNKVYNYICEVAGVTPKPLIDPNMISLEQIVELSELSEPVQLETTKTTSVKDRIKNNIESRKILPVIDEEDDLSREELLKLREKIDRMLALEKD